MKVIKKLLISFISVLCFGLLAPSITSCEKSTVGLEFSLLEDGSAYSVAGIGTATDTDIVIPEKHEGLSVTRIGSGAFWNCESLTSIKIPDSVTSIGSRAFSGCTSLTSITIGNSVTSIDDRAFEGCKSLSSVTIPDNVTRVGARAFKNCSSLLKVKIGNGVTSIDDGTFEGCTSLESVIVSDTVTSIRNGAFYKCSSLKTIYYQGSKEQYEQIKIGYVANSTLINATIIYNYEG